MFNLYSKQITLRLNINARIFLRSCIYLVALSIPRSIHCDCPLKSCFKFHILTKIANLFKLTYCKLKKLLKIVTLISAFDWTYTHSAFGRNFEKKNTHFWTSVVIVTKQTFNIGFGLVTQTKKDQNSERHRFW